MVGSACSQPINKYLPSLADAPSATFAGNPIEDGRDGYDVSCKVSESDDGFDFEANIATPALGADTVNFSLSALLVDGTAMTSSLAMSVAETQSDYEPESPCAVNVIEVSSAPQILSGSAWVTFHCPAVRDRESGNAATCTAEGELMVADCED